MSDMNVLNGATIAFDLDGTLVESAPDLIAAVNAVLIAEDLNPLKYWATRPFISRGARWLLQSGIAANGLDEPTARAAALFDRFHCHYSAHIADESQPFPGVINALERIRMAGAKLVVCTNKPTELSRRLLTELGMVDFFDGIVGIDAVTAPKPDATHLIEAVRAVDGDLAYTIMVGDSGTDASTARAAGTPLILVDFGYTEIPAIELAPDVLLRHFDELVDACTTLLKQIRST